MTYHDDAVKQVRSYASAPWAGGLLGAEQKQLTYVADMADAAKRLEAALRALVPFHVEGDNGAELAREYWTPGYRAAVEAAEAALAAMPKEPT